jgi:hypothetical protein
MTTKKTHRRYPDRDWDYKAISTIINDNGTKRDVYYFTLTQKGKKKESVEIFTGSNYIVGSKDKSNSRHYELDKLPAKYKSTVEQLKKIHKATKWSSAKYINEN